MKGLYDKVFIRLHLRMTATPIYLNVDDVYAWKDGQIFTEKGMWDVEEDAETIKKRMIEAFDLMRGAER